MKEQPKKTRSYSYTNVGHATVRRVLNLVKQGYSYRQIEELIGISDNKVFKIVNGLYKLKEVNRCSECGRKLKDELDVCRECRLRQKYGENPETDPPPDEEPEFFITLDLRPKEFERYLVVRRLKLLKLEREARERELEEERRRRLDDY